MKIDQALAQHFGFTSFRSGQKEIISSILQGRDTLAILPTGGGKSLCFQLPAMMLDGISLVISPLISLMKDQVDTLTEQGIPAAYMNSTLEMDEYIGTCQLIQSGQVKILYVAPERLQTESFLKVLQDLNIQMIAVDEAHCVSQWGHDFRPSYHHITQFIDSLPQRPIVAAFTATATKIVQEDIAKQLQMQDPDVYINSFDRPNIKLSVQTPDNKFKTLVSLLNNEDAVIIYAQTRKNVDQICDKLQDEGFRAVKYHAGLPHEERSRNQEAFLQDHDNIIVATNAFGMGIDKTDVRKVIHYNISTSLENYYQEAGRAGRDSLQAEAILLFNRQDIVQSKFLIQDSQDPNDAIRLESMIQYASLTACIRKYLLRYFGEDCQEDCGNCSSCLQEFKRVEVTKEAQMILSCIVRMKFSYGMTMITDVLKGSRKQAVLDKHFDELTTYGLMSKYSERQIKDIISALLGENYLQMNSYRGLSLTAKAKQLLKGQVQVWIKRSQLPASYSHHPSRSMNFKETENPELFEDLRKLRLELAQEANLPAYIIFSNKTLVDMVHKRPTTYDEFLEIDGVGPVKAKRYAQAFIDVIEEHL